MCFSTICVIYFIDEFLVCLFFVVVFLSVFACFLLYLYWFIHIYLVSWMQYNTCTINGSQNRSLCRSNHNYLYNILKNWNCFIIALKRNITFSRIFGHILYKSSMCMCYDWIKLLHTIKLVRMQNKIMLTFSFRQKSWKLWKFWWEKKNWERDSNSQPAYSLCFKALRLRPLDQSLLVMTDKIIFWYRYHFQKVYYTLKI